jgi:choline dehydrogenase
MLAEKIADRIRGRAPLPRVEVPYYVANGAAARGGIAANTSGAATATDVRPATNVVS